VSYIATVCSDGNVNNAVLLVEFEKNIFEFTLNYAFGEWLREGTVKHQVEDNHPRSSAMKDLKSRKKSRKRNRRKERKRRGNTSGG